MFEKAAWSPLHQAWLAALNAAIATQARVDAKFEKFLDGDDSLPNCSIPSRIDQQDVHDAWFIATMKRAELDAFMLGMNEKKAKLPNSSTYDSGSGRASSRPEPAMQIR